MRQDLLILVASIAGTVILLLAAALLGMARLYVKARRLAQEERERYDGLFAECAVQSTDLPMPREEEKKTPVCEKEFFSLVESLPVGVFKMSLVNKLLYTNERFREMFGISFEEDLPSDWLSLVLEEDRERILTAIDETKLKFRETKTTVRIRTTEGIERRVFFRFSTAISDNEIHFVGIVSDLEEGERDSRSFVEKDSPTGGADMVPAAVRQAEKRTMGRVLLAEDNLLNQKTMRRMLESLGVSCDVAADGAEAIEMWRRGAYDLVVVDCQMPRMDGVETARCMRRIEEESAHRTPVVAMVAPTSSEDRQRCLAVGVNECVTKPVTREILQAIIEKFGVKRRPEQRGVAEVPAEGDSVFDTEVLSRASGGNRRFEEETFDLFLVDTRRRLDRIGFLIVDGRDLEIVHKEASMIKGMCATIGADMMKEAAFRLEKAAAEGDMAGLRSFYDSVEREFERVETVIARYRRAVSRGEGA